MESPALSNGLPTKQFSKFLYLPRPFVIPRALSTPWFAFHRNTNQHHLAAKMSASKVYPLSLVWCHAHECMHFTNGNSSNCVGKQPSKLCVNFIFITQLFLCVKFDVRWQWRHSLFHKYRPSLHWNVTGTWIKCKQITVVCCLRLSSSMNIEIKWNLWGISSNYSFITCFGKVNLEFVEKTELN